MRERFTAVEAARAVNVSEATIRNYIRTGRLVAEKDGTSWSISREALEEVFGPLADVEPKENAPFSEASAVPSTSPEPLVTLVKAMTHPLNEMLLLLRSQVEAKDRRIAELEAQIATLQQKLGELATQVSSQTTSQSQAWQEFLRIHTAQMASLTTQISRASASPPSERKGGFFRRLLGK